ncbi:MAG: hypothetical protein COC08_03360 [Maribacter sp.]|nr:MAG: hypothetical protein COC08_03360 [Maribacter sp.]
MRPKYKALVFNFIGFAVLFIIGRLVFGHFFSINRIFLALLAAIIATVFAPKFMVIKTDEREKLMMKWIFIKAPREI